MPSRESATVEKNLGAGASPRAAPLANPNQALEHLAGDDMFCSAVCLDQRRTRAGRLLGCQGYWVWWVVRVTGSGGKLMLEWDVFPQASSSKSK